MENEDFSTRVVGRETFRQNKFTIIIGFLLVLVLSFKDVVVPDLLGKLMENVQKRKNWNTIYQGVLMVALVWFVMWIINFSYDHICTVLYPRTEEIARTFMLERVMEHLQNSYQDFSHAEMLSQIVQYPGMVSDFFFVLFTNWVPDFIFLVAVIVVFFYYHPAIGAINIAFLIFMFASLKIFWNRIMKHSKIKESVKVDMQEEILDIFVNSFNVLTFGKWKEELDYLHKYETKHTEHYKKYYKLSILLKGIINIMVCFASVGIIMTGLYLFKAHKLEMHSLLSILIILSFWIAKINDFADTMPSIFFYMGIIGTVENIDILKAIPTLQTSTPTSTHSLSKPLSIDFKNVTYSYPNTNKIILDNVTFHIPAGKLVLLKAPVGRGKTTTLGIIMGFRKHQSGKVQIGNMVLGEQKMSEWRKNVVYLSQHPALFNRSLYENITYGSDDNIQHIYDVMKDTGYDNWIKQFPDGLNTSSGSGGSKFSGGQKQLISLFRCLLTPKPVILLDEPTSSLDKKGRELVYSILEKLKGHSTVVVVSHDEHIHQMVDLTINL